MLLTQSEEVVLSGELSEPRAARQLIEELTHPTRELRLGFGADGALAVRGHAYFAGLDFEELLQSDIGPLRSGVEGLTWQAGEAEAGGEKPHANPNATADPRRPHEQADQLRTRRKILDSDP